MKTRVWAACLLVTAASAAIGGCDTAPREGGAWIDVRPSAEVRYATEKISPAVVRIDVVSEIFVQGQARSNRSIGSGVIIDKEGHVLTNFHVAGRARRIDITLANQERVRAKLVGSDHWTDLALVQLDMEDVKKRGLSFDSAVLGDSAAVTLGQPVMAAGTPYGLTRTVTAGIVSNTDRFIDDSSIDGYETGWFNNWIQTDAAINPGNSGGPLINLRGEVIGINTRSATSANNLGFAIPINVAKAVIKEILANGKVARSYVGVQLLPMQDLEQHYELAGEKGVMVTNVEKDSPAAVAGVKAEDLLLEMDGKPTDGRFTEQLASIRKVMSEYPIGATMKLKVRHAGATEPTTLTVKTEKLESVVAEEKLINGWGLSVRELTRAYLRDARLPQMEGVLVTGSRPASSAATANMTAGDIILRVDNKPVASIADLEAAVRTWQTKLKPIGVDVRRDRSVLTLVIKPLE